MKLSFKMFMSVVSILPSLAMAGTLPAVCHPEKFGGKGDGLTLNTQAIQKAIDECYQKGGGTVSLGAGRWLSGPLMLKDHITLDIPQGTVLQASNRANDFVAAFIGRPAQEREAFILANRATDVAITGGGTIDGNGQESWWPQALKLRNQVRSGDPAAFTSRYPGIPIANGMPRPWLVEFNNVTRSSLNNIHLTRSPMWNLVIRNSSDIHVNKLLITNPLTSPNTDGIDIVSSRSVFIRGADIHTGDDNIAIKSGVQTQSGEPSKDIFISDSVMREGHGISVGSETANGIGRVSVSHIRFINTENGLRVKSGRDRGNAIGPFFAEDLTMQNVITPLLVTDSYSGQSGAEGKSLIAPIPHADVTATTPKISGVTIKDLKATGAKYAMIFSGLPESSIRDISLQNITISSQKGVQARYAEGRLKSVDLDVASGPGWNKGPGVSFTAVQ